jgi:hypothetical protein
MTLLFVLICRGSQQGRFTRMAQALCLFPKDSRK